MTPQNEDENAVADDPLQPRGTPSASVIRANINDDEPSSSMLEKGEGNGDISLGLLETVSERQARRRSHIVVYITTFVMSIGFSIVLTGVWPYLQQLDSSVSKEFLGWVVAANPLGQMLASPLFGIWGNKAGSNRGAFISTVFFFVLGNILYAVLSAFGYAAGAVMIFSRFVVGVSSANVAIIRSYVAASTTVKERTTAVSLISAAQGLGFIIGPAFQTAFAVAFGHDKSGTSNFTDPVTNETHYLSEETRESHYIVWDMYTAAGWFAALLGFLNIFLFLPCIYQEYPIAAKEAQLQKEKANATELNVPKPDYLMLVIVLITFFVILTFYVLIETLMVPMTMDLYAWDDETAITVIGIGLSIAGVITVVMFSSVGALSKKFDERKVLIFLGLVPLLVSTFCFFPMGSTYPKMQNCSIEIDDDPIQPLGTILLNDSEVLDMTTVPSISGDIISEHLSSLVMELEPSEDLTKSTDSSLTSHLDWIESKNDSGLSPLSRKRRHVVKDENCRDLGCPTHQAWCLYTPIIERSQLGIASVIAVIGYPVAFALCSAFFSKLLGPKPQGLWMGILTSTGSFSRVVGPIFVSYLYTALGTRWTFGILFVVLALTIIMVCVNARRLVPMKVTVS